MTAGYNPDRFCSFTTELFDLSGLDKTCSAVPNFPIVDKSGVSSLLTEEGNPLVCGGYPGYTDCHIFEPDTYQWIEGPNLLYQRDWSTSVELPGNRHWIANSYFFSSGHGNSEIYQDGEFVQGPDLPNEDLYDYPCAVKISDGEIFYANGRSYIMDTATMEFTETSNQLIFISYESNCGLATKSNGERMIVIAGGRTTGFESAVQIYDIAAGTWRMSENPLPHPLMFGSTVPFGDTFLIVGGSVDVYETGLPPSDEVLQFNPNEETWTVREERLGCGRYGHFAAFVDYNRYGCG